MLVLGLVGGCGGNVGADVAVVIVVAAFVVLLLSSLDDRDRCSLLVASFWS